MTDVDGQLLEAMRGNDPIERIQAVKAVYAPLKQQWQLEARLSELESIGADEDGYVYYDNGHGRVYQQERIAQLIQLQNKETT